MIRNDFNQAVIHAGQGNAHWLKRESYVRIAYERFKAYLTNSTCPRLLVVGCAQGHEVKEFTVLGVDTDGVEINPRYVRAGRLLFPDIKIKPGSVEKLDYPVDTFDLVYCRNVIFSTDPKKSLPELERVLRPGGIGHVTLDKRIVRLNDRSLLHFANIDEMLALLSGCEVLAKEYQERIDEEPWRHKHHYYDIYFRKLSRESEEDRNRPG